MYQRSSSSSAVVAMIAEKVQVALCLAAALCGGALVGFVGGWAVRDWTGWRPRREPVRELRELQRETEPKSRATPTPAPSTDTAKTTVYNVGDLLKPPHRGG